METTINYDEETGALCASIRIPRICHELHFRNAHTCPHAARCELFLKNYIDPGKNDLKYATLLVSMLEA